MISIFMVRRTASNYNKIGYKIIQLKLGPLINDELWKTRV